MAALLLLFAMERGFFIGIELLEVPSFCVGNGADEEVEDSRFGCEEEDGCEGLWLLLKLELVGGGSEGPTPFGRPLCLARSAKARFMVCLIR